MDTSRSQYSASDHTYVEPKVEEFREVRVSDEIAEEPKPEKNELDVFEFGEEEESDAKISYLKSNAKRLAKKEAGKLTSPPRAKPPDDQLDDLGENQEIKEVYFSFILRTENVKHYYFKWSDLS